jgi:hypothetical protein
MHLLSILISSSKRKQYLMGSDDWKTLPLEVTASTTRCACTGSFKHGISTSKRPAEGNVLLKRGLLPARTYRKVFKKSAKKYLGETNLKKEAFSTQQ